MRLLAQQMGALPLRGLMGTLPRRCIRLGEAGWADAVPLASQAPARLRCGRPLD